ncbi:UDP-glycosyltransferase UGT5-like [Coccinella septempunctata]|uniref:UDP-glycosyltransferase UGT5-like n=1 Tax=Coccinella septempunctata TaxID=41139 RepID=UPI001D0861D1|nr:UDP-glycosyltransferase UGT5-like [Coccinella septempunctata]
MRFIFYLFGILSLSECAKILGIFPLNGQSHYRAGLAMMKILAARGHHVTMVSPFRLKNPPTNWRDVVLEPKDEQKMDFFNFNLHPYLQAYVFSSLGPVIMNSTLSHPVFKEFLKTKEKFDVIILEQFYSDGLKYMGTYFDAPLILYSAQGANSWTNPTVGNPAPPSYVADLVLPYSNEMNFFQRMDNAILYLVTETVRYFIALPAHDKIIKKHFPGAPDISEYYNNVSLVLLNGDTSVNEAIPKVPSMVDIGGFHLSPAKPLPADLQKILDEAKHGVVYFSMGSNIRSADMPKEKIDMFNSVFSSLKQTVLWKWEDENLPGKPDNIIIRKWLPQNDILAHKNVKLFITHGGIFSIMEAVNNGVPLLAFPIFGDQMLNAKRATAFGFARWLKFRETTVETLKSELDEILTKPKYMENAMKRSRLMKDNPLSAQERLVFWVEYVIRNKGADHLKVAALKLNLFQYLLLDIILFVSVLSISLIVFLKYALCYLLRLRGKQSSKTKSE